MVIKIKDKSKKRLLKILAIIVAPLLTFFIVFCVLLIVSSNSTYALHKPSIVKQTQEIVVKNQYETYFIANGHLFKYDLNDLKYNYRQTVLFHDNTKLSQRKVTYCDGTFYVSGYCSSSVNYVDYLQFYDLDFNLNYELVLENRIISDLMVMDDYVYLSLYNRDNSEYSLKKVSISDRDLINISDSLQNDSKYNDEGRIIEIGKSHNFITRLFPNKTLLSTWYDTEDNGRVHKYLQDIDLTIDDGIVWLGIAGTHHKLRTAYYFNTFYSNAYLIDNKLVFATYNKLENKKCGDASKKCICSYGESYLFVIDLNDARIESTFIFDNGTFLIDYDQNGAEYYKDGLLYVKGLSNRECRRIKPGEIKTIKGKKSLDQADIEMELYLSYLSDCFYGI